MRILQICPYDLSLPGGVRTHVMELSRELASSGHHVTVVGSASDERFGDGFPDVEVFRLGGGRRQAIWGTAIDLLRADRRSMAGFEAYLRSERPDLIHFHTPWTPFLSWQILWRLRKSGIRRIATFHDTPPDSAFGRFLSRVVMPAAARVVLPWFDAVISVSEVQRGSIDRWATRPITLIPNGVRLPSDLPTPGRTDSERNILFIGRHEPRKGLMHLMEAYRLLVEHHPDIPFSLTVAGTGGRTSEAAAYVTQHSMPRVTFAGFVPESGKQDLLRRCAVFVSPALYGESFGIVLLEAMAQGAPVCGFGNAGYKALAAGYAPELFPRPGDVEGLAEAIVRCVSDEPFRQELVRRGFDLADRHAWPKIAARIAQVYDAPRNP